MKDTEINISDFKDISMSAIEVENEHYKWHSCCIGQKTDSRLLKFCSIYLIIFLVFIFCLIKLFYAKTCQEETTYISLLTFILGLVIPSDRR